MTDASSLIYLFPVAGALSFLGNSANYAQVTLVHGRAIFPQVTIVLFKAVDQALCLKSAISSGILSPGVQLM
jgi:hypothetical protein